MQYKLLKCKQIAYMHFLLALYRLKPVQLGSRNPFGSQPEVPLLIVNRLFDLYTVCSTKNAQSKSVRAIPSRLRDKLMSHILVLALHIDDFSTNLEAFQKDLKVRQQRIVDFYLALGCHVKSRVTQVNGKKIMSKVSELTLPLNDTRNVEGKRRAKKTL
jgi:DNA-directed RNA polymerase I subunit RPA49